MDIADPQVDDIRSFLLVDTFTLNASEERYVPIVSYDEPATVSNHSGDQIRLHIPVGNGWFAEVGAGWPWCVPLGAYVFTLRATSLEAGVQEVVCKVWVDSARRLHFEKA